MATLFGIAAGCVGLAAWAILDWHGSVSPWLLTAGALYLAGAIGLTAAFHQPRNLALATVDPLRCRRRAGRGGATCRSGRRSITSERWRRWAAPRRCRWQRSPVEPLSAPKDHPGDSGPRLLTCHPSGRTIIRAPCCTVVAACGSGAQPGQPGARAGPQCHAAPGRRGTDRAPVRLASAPAAALRRVL